jgi:hypothetical protein
VADLELGLMTLNSGRDHWIRLEFDNAIETRFEGVEV